MALGIGKRAPNEQIINLDQMDPSTCAALKGKVNEYGQCLVDATEHPDDPDTLVLKVMKYKRPNTVQTHVPPRQSGGE